MWKIDAKLLNSVQQCLNQILTSLWLNLKFHYKMFQDEKHCYKESEKRFYFTSFLPSFITTTFIVTHQVTPRNNMLHILCYALFFLFIKAFEFCSFDSWRLSFSHSQTKCESPFFLLRKPIPMRKSFCDSKTKLV